MKDTPRAADALPGWTFEVDEVSAGVYRARGYDAHRRQRVELTGTDPEQLEVSCREAAVRLVNAG